MEGAEKGIEGMNAGVASAITSLLEHSARGKKGRPQAPCNPALGRGEETFTYAGHVSGATGY